MAHITEITYTAGRTVSFPDFSSIKVNYSATATLTEKDTASEVRGVLEDFVEEALSDKVSTMLEEMKPKKRSRRRSTE